MRHSHKSPVNRQFQLPGRPTSSIGGSIHSLLGRIRHGRPVIFVEQNSNYVGADKIPLTSEIRPQAFKSTYCTSSAVEWGHRKRCVRAPMQRIEARTATNASYPFMREKVGNETKIGKASP